MLNIPTLDNLKTMRFTAMAAELEKQLADPKTYDALSFEERVALIVDAEWNRRRQNKMKRLIKQATFSLPSACIEDIEYLPDRNLDKSQFLRFATCQYITENHHIILKGASGSGKTYLACALGNAACRKYLNVKYIRMPDLLDELNVAKATLDDKTTAEKLEKEFDRPLDISKIQKSPYKSVLAWFVEKFESNEDYKRFFEADNILYKENKTQTFEDVA